MSLILGSFIRRFLRQAIQNADTDTNVTGASVKANGVRDIFNSIGSGLSNLWKGFTGSGLTARDIALNQMSMHNVEDQASAQVEGYTKAGINPALMFSGGASSAPQASSSGSVGNMSELLQALMIPAQLKNIASQTALNKSQGEALLINAKANSKNADTNQGNLRVNERNASVNEYRAEIAAMRQQVDAYVARYNLKLTDAQISNLSENSAYLKKQTDQMDAKLEIVKQNAKSNEVSSIAALKSALAQTRKVAIEEKLAPYQQDLLDAQAYVEWANGEGKDIVNRYLDESQRQNIEKTAEEIRRTRSQHNFYDSQTVRNYVNCATDVSDAINRWINPFAKGSSASASAPFDLSGTYQVGAYGYD